MSTIAIMLISHGAFATEALKSAEMIVGKQENCCAMGVFENHDLETLREDLMTMATTLDSRQGLLILTDIIGGTPSNLAALLLQEEQRALCTGLNLPLLLQALTTRDLSFATFVSELKSAYEDGFIMRTKEDFTKKEEEEDDLL